jgi:site-specific DNA recombinase
LNNGKSKPLGTLIRVSTKEQAKVESPEHHEKRVRFYAESKGWELEEVLS